MRASRLSVTAAGAPFRDALGVRTAADLLAVPGGHVVSASRTRSTVRLETAAGAAYLKRYRVPTRHDWWRGALRGTWLGRSKVVREEASLCRLRALGWETPDVLAVAEVRRFGCLEACAILTREVAGAERLDAALWRLHDLGDGGAAERRRLATALGRAVAALHRGGYVDGAMQPRNILVRWAGGGPVFVKLDSPRGGRRPTAAARARDLAALDALAQHTCSRAERGRFLAAYAADRDWASDRRPLLAAVGRARARARRREEPRLEEGRRHVSG